MCEIFFFIWLLLLRSFASLFGAVAISGSEFTATPSSENFNVIVDAIVAIAIAEVLFQSLLLLLIRYIHQVKLSVCVFFFVGSTCWTLFDVEFIYLYTHTKQYVAQLAKPLIILGSVRERS